MVDRHFSTGDGWGQGTYRSTGGTRLREAPQFNAPRDYFADSYYGETPVDRGNYNTGTRYYDSVDWYRPGRQSTSYGTNGRLGSAYTGESPYQGNTSGSSNIRWYNYGQTEDSPSHAPEARKSQPFACEPLQEPDSPKVSTVTSLGNANKCFNQMTFKIFNDKINPGYLLHGICYFDVCEDVKISNITLNGISTVKKVISGKYASDTEAQVNSFKKEIVSSTGGQNKRQPRDYVALTEIWDGNDLMETLQLPKNCYEQDKMEWPFAGPITLTRGTHAIPFAIRIPAEINPTVTYERKGERRSSAVVSHFTTVGVKVDAQPVNDRTLLTVLSEKLQLDLTSCGGLPPVVNGTYAPGCVELAKPDHKDANVLVIMEKKHVVPGDVIRITIYTDNRHAVSSAFADLITSTNLPEIGLSDSKDVIMARRAPGLELLDRCPKKMLSRRFNKAFVSRVGEKYPPSDTNTTPDGRLRSNMDSKRLMPESSRQAGCILQLKVPEDADPSIEAGENRIRYHVRIYLKVGTKTESRSQLVTVAENLEHNYTVKYIKLEN